MAGVILIVAGYAGVGRLMRFVPMPVVTGFTAGIAVIIASSQIGDFLGLTPHAPVDFLEKWAAYLARGAGHRLATLGVGLGTLPLIIALRRLAPRLPAYLIAILVGAIAARLLHLPVETVGDRFPAHADGPAGAAFARILARSWSATSCPALSPSPFSPGSRRCCRPSSPTA